MRTLLFPKASARFADIWHVIGLRGTGSDSYTVTDLFVPDVMPLALNRTFRRFPVVTWATDRPNGFSDADIAALVDGPALGIQEHPPTDRTIRQERKTAGFTGFGVPN